MVWKVNPQTHKITIISYNRFIEFHVKYLLFN